LFFVKRKNSFGKIDKLSLFLPADSDMQHE
jgi:hypothetical protein